MYSHLYIYIIFRYVLHMEPRLRKGAANAAELRSDAPRLRGRWHGRWTPAADAQQGAVGAAEHGS